MSNLKKNVTYNFVYQILILILPFLTAPYLSRIIGANGVGVYSYSYSIALYFTYFTLLGLNKYGNRSIAERQGDYQEKSKTFIEIYAMQFIAFLLCAIVYISYIFFVAEDKTAAAIQFLFVLSGLFDVNWFFFGMEQFKLTVVRNIIVKLLTVSCIFIFVKSEADIYKYVFIMAFGYLVSQVCLWPFLRQYVSFTFVHPRNIIKHIKPNLILFIPVIAVSVYRIMDKVMLGSLSTMESVGFYENAEKITNVPVALITAIGTVMLPRMTAMIAKNQIAESKKYIDRTMFLVLAFANGAVFGIMAVANDFSVIYYGAGFERTGPVMSLLAMTIPFLAVGNVVRTQYLIPNKKDRIYLVSAILGAILNIIINALCIPKYDAVGAAIGTICAEAIVCIYQLYHVRNKLNLKLYLKYEFTYLAFAIVMYIVIIVCPIHGQGVLSLLLKILLGVGTYGVLVLLFSWKSGLLVHIKRSGDKYY